MMCAVIKEALTFLLPGLTVAGQGRVGIFDTVNPNITNEWLAALYGPVLTQPWDPLWLGANIHSNNTAELSAIGEACKWLLDTCSQSPEPSQWEGTMLYDSEYAYGIATRLYHPDSNLILAETIASLVDSVRSKMQLHFKHVRGHRGIYGNEVAGRLADRGSRNRISPHCKVWLPPPPEPLPPTPKARARAPRRRPAAALHTCPKCQKEFGLRSYAQHEPTCRGPGDANITCMFCNKVFQSVQARKNHERYTHSTEALAAGQISAIAKKASKPR